MSNKPIVDNFPVSLDEFPEFVDWPTEGFDKYGNFDFQEIYDVLKAIQTALGYVTAKCAVSRTAVQSIPDSTWTFLSFDMELLDVGDFHSNTENPSRLTVPSAFAVGQYLVGAGVVWETSDVGYRQLQLYLNGNPFGPQLPFAVIPGIPTYTGIFILSSFLSAADYFEIKVWQNSGGALDVLAGPENLQFYLKRLVG